MATTINYYVVGTIIGYLIVLFGISLYAHSKVKNVEDYVVAGRKLNVTLATATLFATWFGAGALITMTDQVSILGLRAGLLDPIGAGLCLIIVGFWFAAPLWRMQLITLADFFRVRFGVRAEKLTAFIMLPTYFGWIAVQFIALAELLRIFTGLPPVYGLSLVAFVGTIYALVGGMWSVTLTDFVQSIALIIGIMVLVIHVLILVGSGDVFQGLGAVMSQSSPDKLVVFPKESLREIFSSLNLLVIGSLGNIAGQDLTQRVFAAKSEKVAQQACVLAGIVYIVVGCLPMLIGLSAKFLLRTEGSVILNLIAQLPSQFLVCVYIVMILSVILSTIDSAILSPATVLAQNLLKGRINYSDLTLNKICVVLIGALSLLTAYVGESAYGLLEQAYDTQLIGLFVPLCVGLFIPRVSEKTIIWNIGLAVGLWLLHKLVGWEYFFEPLLDPVHVPVSLALVALSFVFCLKFRMSPDAFKSYRAKTELALKKVQTNA